MGSSSQDTFLRSMDKNLEKVVVHTECEAKVEISDENSVTAPAPVNRKRQRMHKPRGGNALRWLEEDELVIIDILHENMKKYGFKSHIFSAKDWRDMIDEFWARTGKHERYDQQCIKQKYQRLKRNWADFKELLATCSGYRWDLETNKVAVPNDVWMDHVARYHDHKKFRYHGLKHFDKLNEMFGKNCALDSMSRKSRVSERAKLFHCVKEYLQWKRERIESKPEQLESDDSDSDVEDIILIAAVLDAY